MGKPRFSTNKSFIMSRKTTQQVISILSQGQNVIISAKSRTVEDIARIVQSIGPDQTITIRDADDKTTEQLVMIAQQTLQGRITFDLSKE